MAENQVDGGPDTGTVADANGNASGTQGVQQPSFDAAKLQEVLDAVGTLSKRVDGLQSVKDKQATELTGLKAQIAEYEQLKAKLGSSESAIEQLELRDTLNKMNEQLAKLTNPASPQPDGNGTSGAVNAAKTFANVGFTDEQLKDPRVVVALQKSYESNEVAELAAYRLKNQITNSPSPTLAQAAALQNGSSVAGLSEQQIKDKMDELNQYYLQPSRNAKRITELEKELDPYLPK